MHSYVIFICEIHFGPNKSNFQFIVNVAEWINEIYAVRIKNVVCMGAHVYFCDVHLFLILALKRGASNRGLVPINNNRSASC